jgi:hypothetical protein
MTATYSNAAHNGGQARLSTAAPPVRSTRVQPLTAVLGDERCSCMACLALTSNSQPPTDRP